MWFQNAENSKEHMQRCKWMQDFFFLFKKKNKFLFFFEKEFSLYALVLLLQIVFLHLSVNVLDVGHFSLITQSQSRTQNSGVTTISLFVS